MKLHEVGYIKGTHNTWYTTQGQLCRLSHTLVWSEGCEECEGVGVNTWGKQDTHIYKLDGHISNLL